MPTKRKNGKGKKLMASGSKKLAAWVREMGKGKKNPASTRHFSTKSYRAAQIKASDLRVKGWKNIRIERPDLSKNRHVVFADLPPDPQRSPSAWRGNPRHAGVKLPRSGHTGFLKAKAVDVITRGGRVVEVRVKR